MPTCKVCDEEVDELVSLEVEGRRRKRCEDCAEIERERHEIAVESELAVREMMGFRGKR